MSETKVKKQDGNPTELTVPQTNPLAIIEAAVASGADPAALEKLMELQERYEANNARKAYNAALVAAQAEMPTVFKGRQGQNSQYASFDDIMRVVRPILDAHKLAVSFSQTETADTMTITCRIMHSEGHSEETPFTLPKDGPIRTKDGRNVTNLAQAQGSANSYAKRYCLTNALNIVVGDQDDDAKALDQPLQLVSADQAKELKTLATQAGVEEGKLLLHYKAESFESIASVLYADVKSALNKRIKYNAAQQAQ
jgi:hypothetical protein